MVVVDNRRLLQAERRNNKGDVIDLGAPRPDLSAPRLRNYAQKVGGDRISYTTVDSKCHNLRNNKGDVIDLGVPRPNLSAPRLRNYAQNISGDRISYPTVDSKYHNLIGELEDEINLGGSPTRVNKRRRVGRRRTSALYTPNPRLYQTAPSPAPARKVNVNKRAQSGANSPNRVNKRHKRKIRKYQPNPRLYQAPPNRSRAYQASQSYQPPLQPHTGWLPAPESAPQNTASQIALHFSKRQIIPFRELLPAAINRPVIKPCDTQLPARPTPREKIWDMIATQPGKKRSPSPENKQKAQPVKKRSPSPENKQREQPVKKRNPSPENKQRSQSPKSPRHSPRDKSQKIKSAKTKKGSAKERPEGHIRFLPEDGSSFDVPRYSQNIPTLDDIPHLGFGESSVQNYVNAPVKRYRPRSQHFRLRTLESNSSSSSPPPAARPQKSSGQAKFREVDMATSPHSSNTPEEGSDGNDSLSSAPSEYLAEFLSSIMSRNYAEALKYCRLILHYEPHNVTARGFYPLLKYKLGLSQSPLSNVPPNDGKVQLGSSNSEGSSSGAGAEARSGASQESMDDLEKGSDSEAESVASLSTDSSGKPSRSASPAARDTDSSASECSPEILGVTDVTAIGASWLADDNGNPQSELNKHNRNSEEDEDDENDNGPNDHTLVLKETDIRQLRAQFACSIK